MHVAFHPSLQASKREPSNASTKPEPEPEVTDEVREAAAHKVEALKEKEAGNDAYKKKDFDAAIAHYNRALELYDGDMTFLTNRAAVFFEQVCGTHCEWGDVWKAHFSQGVKSGMIG